MSRRIRITVSYDGTDFHGWQVQPGLTTIQGVLEEILGGMEGSAVHVAGSGRTDAGVHARAQVAALTIANPIPVDNLLRALNRLLPAAVRVLRAEEVHADFHPRFDAVAKTYRYTILRAPICSPFAWRFVYHHPFPLDEEAMIAAAPLFTGEHDFTAYAAADDRDRAGEAPSSKVRRVFRSCLEKSGEELIYTVRGSGFLKHMVRNIVGMLIEVGRSNMTAEDLKRYLTLETPGKVNARAPSKGLCLESVEYGSSEP